ncbi:hypothetical protein M8R19_04020 [Pseudomonas sp. R3.Fl]|uniref:hypothetical protein n=1 Tax=Pseudomonas sp. R3.Fl TaxID=2928708 RepID=UPI00201DC216|nr:hypothetical protein [Pseudomonas sp. R3.Fl]MCL6687878.1 hypothetical protein [Pseudomonas sp. R3.Fl]
MSLEQLALIIGLQDYEIDCENEDEWAIGSCCGVSKIDISRHHRVDSLETDTTIFRYASGMDRVIPKETISKIIQRLIANGVINITVSGFDTSGRHLSATTQEELGV